VGSPTVTNPKNQTATDNTAPVIQATNWGQNPLTMLNLPLMRPAINTVTALKLGAMYQKSVVNNICGSII
jgi:hypothetical protein